MQDIELLDEAGAKIVVGADVIVSLKYQAITDYICNGDDFPHSKGDRYEAGAALYDFLSGLDFELFLGANGYPSEANLINYIESHTDGFCPEVYAPYADMPLANVVKLIIDQYQVLETYFRRNLAIQLHLVA